MSFAIKVILVLLSVFILEFYFFKRVLISISNLFPKLLGRKFRIVKWILIIVVNLYPVFAIAGWIYTIVTKGGYFEPPDNIFFNYFVLYPFWIGTMIIVQSTLFFLIIEILSLITFPFVRKFKEEFRKVKSTAIFFVFIVFLVYVPLRIIYDYKSVDITEITYSKENLPKVLDGFKIAFISDIQADEYTDKKRLGNYIEKVNSTNPDLVLMGGDMITSTPDYIDLSAEELNKIKSKYGVFTCVGDHDNWAYRNNYTRSLSEITQALASVNIPMIDNNKLYLGIDSANIAITFITNTYVEKINPNILDSLTNNTSKADVRIFLTHQPRQFLIDKAVKKNYDLYLCGHTHGGQITFLFPFYNLSPTLIETPYVRGEFYFGKMLMIVTRGLGMSLAPVRYNSTPEVTVIHLKRRLY